MSNLGTVPGAGQPWKQQYDFNTELSPNSLTWTTATSLPATVVDSQVIVTKNRVYLLGGYINDSPSEIVYTAPINADGTIGVWTRAASLPGTVFDSQVIVTKNRVYLLGGYINDSPSEIVYTAPINADGTIGVWTRAASLPVAVRNSHAIVTKNKVYLLGGVINDNPSNTVYTASINADGTLGVWTTASSLPGTVRGSQAIVTKNKVYLLGGIINGNPSNTVYTASINADGTLGAWTTAASLPATVYSSQAIVTRNRVYLLGGLVNGDWSDTVYTATISADGTLGEWTTDTSLPSIVAYSQTVITKNKVFLLGGVVNDDESNAVYTAPFTDGLNDYSEFY